MFSLSRPSAHQSSSAQPALVQPLSAQSTSAAVTSEMLLAQAKAYRRYQKHDEAIDSYIEAILKAKADLKKHPDDQKKGDFHREICLEYASYLETRDQLTQAVSFLETNNTLSLQNPVLPRQSNEVGIYGPRSERKEAIFKRHSEGLSTQSPFFKAPPQGQPSHGMITALGYPAFTQTNDLQETRHLAWCYEQILASNQGREGVPPEAESLIEEAECILAQFGKGVKNLTHIQELVALGTINHTGLHRKLINTLLDALKLDHVQCLDSGLLNGLCRVLLSTPKLKPDRDTIADYLRLLSALLESLQKIQSNQNSVQVRVLLDAISLLLDQMVNLGVSEIDRKRLQEALKQEFDRFGNANPELAWTITYAQQALARLSSDETFWEKIKTHLSPTIAGSLYLTGGILKFLAASMASPGSALGAVIIAGFEPDRFIDAFEALKEGLRGIVQDKVELWYTQLRLVDVYVGLGLKTGRFDILETLLNQSRVLYEENFLRGLCDRLEHIACAQVTETTRDSALSMLKGLSEGTIVWGNREVIKQYAQATLKRMVRWQSSEDPLFNIKEPDIQEMARGGYTPPAWHAFWSAAPQKILLQEVHNIRQRAAIVSAIPNHFSAIRRGIADIASNTTPASVGLKEVRTALRAYYERPRVNQLGLLSIQRISGAVLSLEDCYVNLAIVEGPQQHKKEKKALQEKTAVFHRMSSYEQIEKTNLEAPIALEDLFNERLLRNGQTRTPTKILIEGRAGIGKTTLCKKLVYEYQKGMWKGRFDAVLWLPLRDLKNCGASSLYEVLLKKYFAHHEASEQVPLLANMLSKNTNRILFILDGLDEVSTEMGQPNSPLGQLINILLYQPHVILTSRPSGVDFSILPPIDLELETVGFSQEDIHTYLEKVTTPETATAMKDFFAQTPMVHELANTPVLADILSLIWDPLQAQIKAGSTITMTSLYKTMISKLLRNDTVRGKELAGDPVNPKFIQHLNSALFEVYMGSEKEEYLSYLAFQGRQDDILEFNDDYRQNILLALNKQGKAPLSPELLYGELSFLHTTDTKLDDPQRTWYFLHQTFQDFFAAKFLARHLHTHIKKTEVHPSLPSEHAVQTQLGIAPSLKELEAFIATHKYHPRYEIVWPMVVGLLKGKALEHFFKLLNEAPLDLIGTRHQQVIIECLNEARPRLMKETVDRIETELMQWLRFETKLSQESDILTKDSPTNFPEHLLLMCLGQPEWGKVEIINILKARPNLSENAVSALIEVLKTDENKNVRDATSDALCSKRMLSEDAVSILIKAFKENNDKNVRSIVVEALGYQQMRSKEVILALIDALKDDERGISIKAAEGLSSTSYPGDATLALINALKKDTNDRVRSAVAKALGSQKIQPKDTVLALIDALKNDTNDDVRRAAAEALGSQSMQPEKDVVWALIDALKNDTNDEVRREAAKTLGSSQTIQPEDVALALINALKKDTNGEVRHAAARTLGSQPQSKDVIFALIDVLKEGDDNAYVKYMVIRALGSQQTQSEDIILAFIETLNKNSSQYVKSDLIKELGLKLKQTQIHSEEAVSALIDVLKTDTNDDVRHAAAEALGSQPIQSKDIILALSDALKKNARNVSGRTTYAIARALGSQQTPSKDAVSALIDALKKGKSDTVRSAAAEELGSQQTQSEDIILALIDALKEDANYKVRREAAEALGSQKTQFADAILALIDALKKDTNDDVRGAAARALGSQPIESQNILSALIEALKKKNIDGRSNSAAAEALGSQQTLSKETILALIETLKEDDDCFSRSAAAEVLGSPQTQSEDAVPALINALKEDTNDIVRSAVTKALGSQQTQSKEIILALIDALEKKDLYFHYKPAEVLKSHIDKLPLALPSLKPEQMLLLYTRILFPQSHKQVLSLYIQDSRLHFYTAAESGKSELLKSDQIAEIVQLFETTRARILTLEKAKIPPVRYKLPPMKRSHAISSWSLPNGV